MQNIELEKLNRMFFVFFSDNIHEISLNQQLTQEMLSNDFLPESALFFKKTNLVSIVVLLFETFHNQAWSSLKKEQQKNLVEKLVDITLLQGNYKHIVALLNPINFIGANDHDIWFQVLGEQKNV